MGKLFLENKNGIITLVLYYILRKLPFARMLSSCDILRQVAVINLTGIIADMSWTYPAYYEKGHACKVWSVEIVFARR